MSKQLEKERRIITVRLESPKHCALSITEVEKIMEVYRMILRAFICDDYNVMVESHIDS